MNGFSSHDLDPYFNVDNEQLKLYIDAFYLYVDDKKILINLF